MSATVPDLTYADAVRAALVEEMNRDERVILMGEDIAEYGGAFRVTQGLVHDFGSDTTAGMQEARAHGWAKVEQCRSNCGEQRRSSCRGSQLV